MEKSFVTYKGKEYVTREVDLSYILEGYGMETIGSDELNKVLSEDTNNYSIDGEGTQIDNTIYCYMKSGFLESDPTDAEILLEIVEMESLDLTDQEWYNLMRLATLEINQMYAQGAINVNCEGYECSGQYSVYAYTDGVNRNLYYGSDARVAAMVAISFGSAVNLMQRR